MVDGHKKADGHSRSSPGEPYGSGQLKLYHKNIICCIPGEPLGSAQGCLRQARIIQYKDNKIK